MDDKIRCQSCGMPLSDEFGNFGTMSDGSSHTEFCMFCYEDGDFTNPVQTMDEMIQSSIQNMMQDLDMTEDRAKEIAWDYIPNLKRWNN